MKLMIDNKSTISLVKNLVLHGRSKLINTKFYFLRNQVYSGMLEVVQCSTHIQITVQNNQDWTLYPFGDKIGVVDFN